MLLSRVATSLYWMGRYLERAENANRHLIVAGEFSVELEGIDADIALQEWESLKASMPNPTDLSGSVLDYMVSFLLDRSNGYSVIASLARARENARSVAETTTIEVITNLNDAYRKLSTVSKERVTDMGIAHDLASTTHTSILTTLGAVEHTLTRGEGWNYMKMGEALERTQRTLYVLKTRLPNLQQGTGELEAPLYFASWRSMLLSLATLENYRQEHGPRFLTEMVTRFLLFNVAAPRSVNCGVKRMVGYLQKMSDAGPGIRESRRKLGKLSAQLDFDQEEILRPEALIPFLDHALTSLYEVHEAMTSSMRLS